MVTASARSLPALMYSIDSRHAVEHDLYLSAEQVGHRRRITSIRHVEPC